MSDLSEDFIAFGAPKISEKEIHRVAEVLRSGWIGKGEETLSFEKEFATYKGALGAVGVNSCTAALHLSLLALGIGPGDEVITTANTFCSTVNTIIHAGAKPVLVDIDPHTWNIDCDKIEEKINPQTKCIIPVHFAGRLCDMEKITELARLYNLFVVEDCAHAIETERMGKKAGTFGDAGCFSFYSTKNITSGEGGMIISRSPDFLDITRKLSLHGLSRDAWARFSKEGSVGYDVEFAGYKYNMFDMIAALGRGQLLEVNAKWEKRQKIWDYYNAELVGLPIVLPAPEDKTERHACHLYTILLETNEQKTRDEFINFMKKKNIGTGVHYQSIASIKGYQKTLGVEEKQFPVAANFGRQTVSLPLTPYLSDNDVKRVTRAVRSFWE